MMRRREYMWRRRDYVAQSGGFNPAGLSKVSAWLRHTQTSLDLTSWTDMFGSNHATSDASHAPTAATSAGNGRAIATYVSANNDAMSWPLHAGNNQTTKTGFAVWVNQPTNISETIINIGAGTAGASAGKIRLLLQTTRRVILDVFISGTAGRRGTTANNALPVAGTWFFLRCAYDSLGATEDLRSRIYVNEVYAGALTFTDLGAGGTTGALPSVTGNANIGNINFGTSNLGLNGSLGPNLYCLSDDLTASEGAALMNFEAPT